MPDHAPDAVQDSALVEAHVSVEDCPAMMLDGTGVNVKVGGTGGGSASTVKTKAF